MQNQPRSQIAYNAIILLPVDFKVLKIGIHTKSGALADIDFLPSNTSCKKADNNTAQQVVDQLTAYFKNARVDFDVPLLTQGTDFQQKVWQALQTIPSGQTCNYADIAKRLNSSARAVGNACRANAIPIIIPCHRVVVKKGVGGYCGQTNGERVQIKQWLLQYERA